LSPPPRPLAVPPAAALLYDAEHVVVPVGDHSGASLLELMDDDYDVGLRLGSAGDWSYAVAYGGWQSAFGPLAPLSDGGAHVCLLEYEEENGKPVPPQFASFQDGRVLAAFNLHLDRSWGSDKVDGDPVTATGLQERLTAAGLPDPERDHRDIHRAALGVIEDFFGLSLPREVIVSGSLPAVLLEPV
ncbi:hypothetical protein AB0L50_38515, partial [Streptomyces flaveolus]|uniref:hypothetical protein n=1 Tax=Streptomyces flaveolus TaxID=67297 RepID=UPI003423F3AE